ncbi:MAG: MerR family transcriptional regulator [Bacteroidales bacterium]|nr:MerR family transcriptional regulator [Bacteroidales bacterium]
MDRCLIDEINLFRKIKMANYSIKDLETFTGIKAHTIRIWEKRYSLVEPKRTCTNIRYYDDDDLKRLLNISILNRNGIKISNIVNLSDEAISEKIINLSGNANDSGSQIENLVVAMIDLDENKFEKIFSNAVMSLGFEEAVLTIIYPFFEKIGILWQIGTINPAQEHFVSNILRQKILVATNGIVTSPGPDSKSFLLYLPEGEHHELGLLFYQYLLRKHGQKVVYLGETVPFAALQEVYKIKKIDHFLTAFVNPITEEKLQAEIDRISETFPDVTLFLTGFQVNHQKISIQKNAHIIKNISEFKKALFEKQE